MPLEICRHTKANGRRCQSPAQNPTAYCYHHRRQLGRPLTRVRQAPIDLPPFEGPESFMPVLSTVLQALASGRIETARANAIVYALQSANTIELMEHCP